LQTNLVSNLTGAASTTDLNLVNAWGLSRSSSSPWWVSDNGTGKTTLFTGTGTALSLVITIPPAPGSGATAGSPTGTVFNGTTGFVLPDGAPALFMFATEDGTISAWNSGAGTTAVIVVDTNGAAVFKGLAMATFNDPATGPTTRLYAADFRRARIQVYDSTFHHIAESEARFEDDQLPAGFAPFNVQNIGGNLYVSFAAQDRARHDEIDGAGLGYVDVFSPRGELLLRFEHGPWFNAPWGMTAAPSDFGIYSHDILVGQFGSGQILAFNPVTGHFRNRLYNTSNNPLEISGLWGLSFGNNGNAGPATTLYFAAGPNGETNGLFGSITAAENTLGGDD
jgi:uncharacterized protein (TIGR03118 family)